MQPNASKDLTDEWSVPRHLMPPPSFLPIYDPLLVQEHWENCIRCDVPFLDPYFCLTTKAHRATLDIMHSNIEKRKILSRRGKFNVLSSLDFTAFRCMPFRRQRRSETMFWFEGRMFRMKLKLCHRCHQCRLNLSVADGGKCCSGCCGAGNRYIEDQMSPIWCDNNGVIQHHVPRELSCLTIGEQLLIQRVSPHVPIAHVKNGTLGIKGHVCSFSQDTSDLAKK